MSDETVPNLDGSRRDRLSWIVGGCVIVCVAAGALAWWAMRPTLPAGITPAEYAAAIAQFEANHQPSPDEHAILMLLGQTAFSENRLATARACFAAVPDSDVRYGASARLQEAHVALKLDLAHAAEKNFRTFLALAARRQNVDLASAISAKQWLAYILSVELRIEEREVVLKELHDSGQANVYDSKQLYLPNLLIWPSPVGRRKLEAYLKQDANDPLLLTAWGRYLTAEGNPAAAREVLEPLCEQDPRELRRAAALLEVLFEQNDWPSFESAYSRLPAYRDYEPRLLTRLRGRFALQQGRWQEAIDQFDRLLEVDPSDPAAHAGLARAYGEVGRSADRDRELMISATLAKIRVELVRVTGDDAQAAAHLAAQCREIGLADAANAFAAHADRIARTSGDLSRENGG